MAGIDVSKYAHSPVHKAVILKDHSSLKRIISSLSKLSNPDEIKTESASIAEEEKAEAIASVIDRRDVPNRETPLHLAVKLSDPTSVEILMRAGADWSLQNEQGWSALQEAICSREENIAKIIVRHYQPLAWAKWCRRLPRLVAAMRRMRDFYMEITFNFESSVIPFVSRIAPSDTYKIWKRGGNLRADMTLAGFDGFKIQRSDQSVLFLGDGSEDGRVPEGTLCMVSHKDKEVMNALEGAGVQASEEEIQHEVRMMFKTNMFRPGIDVTQALLLPQLNWRRQEKTEMVGEWKAKVYDMHHVVVSVKSRKVPGAMSDEELFSSCNESSSENDVESDGHCDDVLTKEEQKQLENVLKMESLDIDGHEFGSSRRNYEIRDIHIEDVSSISSNGESKQEKQDKQDKRKWLGGWGKKVVPPRRSLLEDSSSSRLESEPGKSMEVAIRLNEVRNKEKSSSIKESEYKKGLRPTLWLSPSFPLKTEELLPLLDILANKVKAIRRLRDLLTTKLPPGTFPVKVAIPVVPTIRVLVTFTKFEELQSNEVFSTPPSSPSVITTPSPPAQSSSSWLQWIKTPYIQNYTYTDLANHEEDIQDPFLIPRDYTWTTPEAKKKKMQESKVKSKKKSSSESL